MGEILKAEGNIPAARKYYELALEIRKQLAEESPTIQIRRDLSISYNKLGNICEAEGDISAARKYYELALEISKQLAEEAPTPEAWDDLAISYYNLGILKGAFFRSCYYFRKALAIWTNLSEQYPSVLIFAQRRDGVREELKKRGK